ncbi:MAG: DUF192 domain-containing protein [Candidatus Levybacteria bacterium]|nr:DUF192 domain-containing protein [Candidatus Levybacteria bacterium]
MQNFINLVKNNIRLLVGGIVVGFLGILLVLFILSKQTTKVLVNDQSFSVSVAKTEKEKQIGLSKTTEINENQGMLFIFDEPDYYSFWMKDMKFPIDIIYINGDKIVTVIDNAKPPVNGDGVLEVYQPEDQSDKVLEISAGLAKKYNIKKGTTIKIENL